MKTKVLMVCLGNICRSPLAQGILQSKVDADKVTVDSCGTAGYHVGKRPDPRSIEVAKKHGLDITEQRCRQLSVNDFDDYDLIFAMDKSNYADILAKTRNTEHAAKVKLLLNEISIETDEVPDPYYGGEGGFEYVFQLIDKACEAISKKL